jgi:hypothetical protein
VEQVPYLAVAHDYRRFPTVTLQRRQLADDDGS